MKAIDVGKTAAIDTDKKLLEKAAKRLSTPKTQVANVMIPLEEITKKVNEVIANMLIQMHLILGNWLWWSLIY